tara:strand:- start:27 stop:194 length:168 start_codon:yes stop_codon:yes gene_type:complete
MTINRSKINQQISKSPNKAKFPKLEKYVGRYIKGDLGGVKVSNPSYVKYYKDLIK